MPTTRRLAVAAVLVALALTAAPAPAGAGTGALDVGRLVLSPAATGYVGDLRITVRNTRPEAVAPQVFVTEPVAGSWSGAGDEFCMEAVPRQSPRVFHCSLGLIEPGGSHTFAASFTVRTAPRPYAMAVRGGTVSASVVEPPVDLGTAPFATLFRATGGSLRNPRPYVQDTSADAGFAGADVARLRLRPDGSWAGTLRVEARWRGDAAHRTLYVNTALPAGVRLDGTEPAEVPCWDECPVPGGPFMEGERRAFDLLLVADAGTPAGPLGAGTATLSALWNDGTVPDPAPRNNTVRFAVVATP
jgi:hypothetical protein